MDVKAVKFSNRCLRHCPGSRSATVALEKLSNKTDHMQSLDLLEMSL